MNGERGNEQAATRWVVHFSGRVQGVGFRYTARHIAMVHPVAGYVRNLPDGRVLLVAEGAEGDLEAYVKELSGAMSGNITKMDVSKGAANGEFGAPAINRLQIRH